MREWKRNTLNNIDEKLSRVCKSSSLACSSSFFHVSIIHSLSQPTGQVHYQQLQVYTLLTLQPQRRKVFPWGVLEKVLKKVLTGSLWVMFSSLKRSCAQERCGVLTGWACHGSIHKIHRWCYLLWSHGLRVRAGWHSHKRREWMLGRQKLQMSSNWVIQILFLCHLEPFSFLFSLFLPHSTAFLGCEGLWWSGELFFPLVLFSTHHGSSLLLKTSPTFGFLIPLIFFYYAT